MFSYSKSSQINYLITLSIIFFSVSVPNILYSQKKICFFKYGAIPDAKNQNRWMFLGKVSDTIYITKFDYSNPDECIFISSYGRKTEEERRTTIRVKDGSFDNEPKEIRGHKLLGAYFNPKTGLYELYYVLPGHSSMLMKHFSAPGKLFIYSYASDKKINPFEGWAMPYSLNDTIRLTPVHAAKPVH